MTRNDFDPAQLSEALRLLIKALPDNESDLSGIKASRRRNLRLEIGKAIEQLSKLSRGLDPIAQPPVVFDPSDPDTVGTLIARTMLEQERIPLSSLGKFYGSGVYAIYYRGDFSAYSPIRGTETPIYVGKADPATPGAATTEEQGDRLSRRLHDHYRSITNAENLSIEDFDSKHLVVKSAWQSTAETYLIDWFKPIWNKEIGICEGFGKHGDSAATRSNTRSPWDTVHPGRLWAKEERNVPNPLSPRQIKAKIAAHYRENPPEQ